MEMKMEMDEEKKEKYDYPKMRKIIQDNTKIVDGHLIWIGELDEEGRFQLIRVASYKRMYPFAIYNLLQEHDQDQAPQDEDTSLTKQCKIKLCISHYVGLHKNLKSFSEMNADDLLHLINRLEKNSVEQKCEKKDIVGNCRFWTGSTNNGKGITRIFAKSEYVHRIAYVAYNFGTKGIELSDIERVTQICGNALCFEASHLYGGDIKQVTTKQRETKRREKHQRQKLTEEQVKEIIQILCKTKLPNLEKIAQNYKVKIAAIINIQKSQNWKHLISEEEKQQMDKNSRKGTKRKWSKKQRETRKKNINSEKYLEDKKKLLKEKVKIQQDKDDEKEFHEIWLAAKNKVGYGVCSFRGKVMYAHAVSYLVHNGIDEIPKGQLVRHKCKEKLCINKDHLELGTPKENAADRLRDKTDFRGEKSPLATITDKKAKKIKKSQGKGKVSERAKQFGVSSGLVRSIDYGNRWKHV